jgi:serine/threonine protein phosphatase PrpC
MTREEALRIKQAERASDLLPGDQTHFARRNEITCAVGWTDFSHIQTRSLALVPGDRILFCTDGIHDNLTDQEIEEVLQGSDGTDAQRLVSAAYHRSQQTHLRAKQDDISAIVAQYRC